MNADERRSEQISLEARDANNKVVRLVLICAHLRNLRLRSYRLGDGFVYLSNVAIVSSRVYLRNRSDGLLNDSRAT